MHKYSKDIMWGLIAIVVVMFFLTGKLYIFPIILIVCLSFSLGRDESQFWENRPHDEDEQMQERKQEPELGNQRSVFSLRPDESQFWENRPHDEDEQKTDYSQVHPCFRGDDHKNR